MGKERNNGLHNWTVPCQPVVWRGEEYPAHFKFFKNGHDPKPGDIVGYAPPAIPETYEHKIPGQVLIWDGIGIVAKSNKR